MPDEKKRSSAAPVITPISYWSSVPSRTPATAPKWAYWPESRHVAPWQAVALSLNFQPWEDRPRNFYPDIFPDADTETKFKSRYDLMLACLQSRNAMLLSDFATWAISVNLELPPELAAMAQKSETTTTVIAEQSNAGSADNQSASRWPWGKHETALLQKLAAAAEKWWQRYDATDATTAPTNQQVIDWLKAQGVSNRIAESMATILRADGLPTGPRK